MRPVYFVSGEMMPVDVLTDEREARELFATMLAVEFPVLFSWDGRTLRSFEPGMGFFVVEGDAMRSRVQIKILEACRMHMGAAPVGSPRVRTP